MIAAAAACLSAPAVCGPVVPFARVIGGSVGFGKTADGRTARLYTLTNRNGMRVRFTDFGGRITEIDTPDRAGKYANVAIGLRSAADYQASSMRRSDSRYWDVSMRPFSINHGAVLTLTRSNDEQGRGGKRVIRMRYTLTKDNELRIDTSITPAGPASLDRVPPLRFNLGGQPNSDLGGHLIQIRANGIAESGRPAPASSPVIAAEGPYDLRSPRMMRDGLNALRETGPGGYDTPYILAGGPRKKPVLAVRVTEPGSGRMMEVYTTEPAIRFVAIEDSPGRDKAAGTPPSVQQPGFALEPQPLPDGTGTPQMPAKTSRAGRTYKSTTIYRFVTPVDRLHN